MFTAQGTVKPPIYVNILRCENCGNLAIEVPAGRPRCGCGDRDLKQIGTCTVSVADLRQAVKDWDGSN